VPDGLGADDDGIRAASISNGAAISSMGAQEPDLKGGVRFLRGGPASGRRTSFPTRASPKHRPDANRPRNRRGVRFGGIAAIPRGMATQKKLPLGP
jgi:hypothetical protein